MTELKVIDGGIEDDNSQEVEEVTPEAPSIVEVRNFSDGENRTVIGQFPVDGSDPTFTGVFMVGTNRGPIRLNMEFATNNTLEDCFEEFDVLAQETVEKAQKEAQEEMKEKSRIVTPEMLRKSPQIIT